MRPCLFVRFFTSLCKASFTLTVDVAVQQLKARRGARQWHVELLGHTPVAVHGGRRMLHALLSTRFKAQAACSGRSAPSMPHAACSGMHFLD